MEPNAMQEAHLLRAEGVVQGVGFRRFVQRTARKFNLLGYVENLKDGSVRIFVQGNPETVAQFASEVKDAPGPIAIERLEGKKTKLLPRLKSFTIKTGPLASEILEGFGGMETEFRDYREEFKGYTGEFRDYRGEFRDYRSEFRQFANRTDENFKSLGNKDGESSAKLTHILETLENESTETRRELTRAVDSLLAAVQKQLAAGKTD